MTTSRANAPSPAPRSPSTTTGRSSRKVRGTPIHEDEVEVLANDAGFQTYMNAPAPEGELSGSPAGRAALGWLVEVAAIEAELERRGVEVDDETRATAEERVRSSDVDVNTADNVVHEVTDPSPEVAGIMSDALAAYLTLDEFLRGIDPSDPEEADDLREVYPNGNVQACGHVALVATQDEQEAIELVQAGTTITELAQQVDVIGTSELGDPTCVTASEVTNQIADLLREAPLGAVATQRAYAPGLGADGVAFVQVTDRGEVDPGADPDAYEIAVQQLAEQGITAFAYIEARAVEPEIDEAWGERRPSVGVVAVDAAPSYTVLEGELTFEAPPPTTAPPTTASPAPTTASPPTPTGLSQLLYAIPDPGTSDLVARSQAALDSSVTSPWLGAIPVGLSIIGGATSLSGTDGTIEVGSYHASGEWARLQEIMAHEFGHHVAFRYGTQAELGAAPAGWPLSGSPPVERWADCVSTSFTGNPLGSHGQTPCEGPSLDFTVGYMTTDPNTLPRTG